MEELIMTVINHLDSKIDSGDITQAILWYKYDFNYHLDYFIIYAKNKEEFVSLRICEDIIGVTPIYNNSPARIISTIWTDESKYKELWREGSIMIYSV